MLKFLFLFGLILVGVSITILTNYLSVSTTGIKSTILLILRLLPLTMLSSFCYIIYFQKGSELYKFGTVYLISLSLGIIITYLVQVFLFKDLLDIYQIIGTIIILVGIIVLNLGLFIK